MNEIATLTELLEAGGARPRFYDMGRRIVHLPRESFVRFEHTQIPYPQPLQQQAWFAMVLQPGAAGAADPLIWFLHFPLDEQAKLLQAARDDFVMQLVEHLGSAGQALAQNPRLQQTLEQSPYAFQPKQERLAALHARLTVDLSQPPSRYYEHAKRYFDGELGWDQWSFIGYQGIADLAARFALADNTGRIAAALDPLPPVPLEALCHCLENEAVPAPISQALLQRVEAALREPAPDPQVVTAVLRGVSHAETAAHRRQLALLVLDHPLARGSDVLAAVAGRLWGDLCDHTLCRRFLERLAENDQGQHFFDRILSDLLYLPETRPCLLERLRDPARSAHLGEAIGAFFTRVRQG
ncbi:MAG: DUF3549 family protein [Candidatus Thiodiazotropha sp.]